MNRLHLIIYSVKHRVKPMLASCLVLLCLPAIHAQGLHTSNDDPLSLADFAGTLTIRTAELAEQGDSLLLSMELVVNEEAISKRQSWAIVPQLMAEENGRITQITFPYALINGRIREHLFNRKLNFGNRELLANLPYVHTSISRRADGKETVLPYTARVLYEPWMDMADLKLHAILVSPAGKRQLLTVANAGRVAFAPRAPYEVRPHVNLIEPAPEQKQRKVQRQAYLDFRVGRSEIIPTFRRNPEELGEIAQAMQSVRTNPDARITGLYIEGYASPEGGYAMNERLARSRSEALRDYMVKEFALDRELFRVGSMGEDWEGLRALVQESSLTGAQREAALTVIDSSDDYDLKESRLRAQTATWRLMNAEMFPQLRRVEYRIDFQVKDYTLEESGVQASRNPEMLSQRELFLLAMSYPEGTKDREDTFELIARLYPDDVVAAINTGGMMLLRGELTGAKRMLDKAEGDPRAFNNLGLYYLLAGEPDKAGEYLGKAVEMGIPEAAANMEELKKKTADDEKIKRYQR